MTAHQHVVRDAEHPVHAQQVVGVRARDSVEFAVDAGGGVLFGFHRSHTGVAAQPVAF